MSPLIDGVAIDSASDTRIDLVNPSTGISALSIPAGCDADAERAVRSARRAFEDGRWSESSPAMRKQVLHRWAEAIAAEAAWLDELDAEEMGKPIGLAFANARWAAGLVRFHAEAVDKITGDVFASDRGSLVVQRRVARGVVAAITPWNFPTANAAIKLAPALAAGNCVVHKPSELSSRSALRLGELAMEAGMPEGVLNVVPGLGGTVGRALGLHRDVDLLTFTGSTEIGKRMLQYAGQSNLKLVMTECGGKSPQVVFDDGVDLDAAAQAIARFLLTNQGQICSVGSRLLVQRSVEAAMVEKIASCFKDVRMGDARNPQTTFGPLASIKQCERVMEYIDQAQKEGARLAVGGRRALIESGGLFVEPTIFTAVTPQARIAREEIFGPVLSVIPFDDVADAIRIANGTSYGLTGTVWTANLSTAMRVAKGLRSSVRVNAVPPVGDGAGYVASSEPARESGIGTEGGIAGIESYLRRQLVTFSHGT